MAENSFVDLKINSPASGSVYFASDVIATIAGLSLTEIEGIANIIKYGGLRNDKSGKKNTLQATDCLGLWITFCGKLPFPSTTPIS